MGVGAGLEGKVLRCVVSVAGALGSSGAGLRSLGRYVIAASGRFHGSSPHGSSSSTGVLSSVPLSVASELQTEGGWALGGSLCGLNSLGSAADSPVSARR